MIRKALTASLAAVCLVAAMTPAVAESRGDDPDNCKYDLRFDPAWNNLHQDHGVSRNFESNCVAIPNRAFIKVRTTGIDPEEIPHLRIVLARAEWEGPSYQMKTIVRGSTIYGVLDEFEYSRWLMGDWFVHVEHGDGPDSIRGDFVTRVRSTHIDLDA